MHLSNIKLWNFRKFGSDEEIDIDKPNLNLNFTKGLNVIIGENDSGKTAIIDAMKLVLKTHSYDYIRIEDRDFYNDTNRFRIELTFDGLEAFEAKNFTEWLNWDGEKGKGGCGSFRRNCLSDHEHCHQRADQCKRRGGDHGGKLHHPGAWHHHAANGGVWRDHCRSGGCGAA